MTTITLGSLLRWPGRAVGACLIGAIRLYQVTLSPLLGPACRFEPSCSRYMVESIKKYGALKGLGRGLTPVFSLPPVEPRGLRPAVTVSAVRWVIAYHCPHRDRPGDLRLLERSRQSAAAEGPRRKKAVRPHLVMPF